MGLGTGPLEHRPDEPTLVVGRVFKAGREGLLSLSDKFARDCVFDEHQIVRHADDRGGVQTSAQTGPDGDVAAQTNTDRIPRDRHGPAVHRQSMRGRKLPDALEEGVLGIIEAGPLEVVEDRAIVRGRTDADGEQSFDLRGKREPLAVPVIIEGFLSHAVSCAEEPPTHSVPEGEGEHPVQACQTALPPLPVRREQDFGIRARAEPMPVRPQFLAQLKVIVDLPVVRDPAAPVLRGHRLMAER